MEHNIDLDLLRKQADLYKMTFSAYAKIPKTSNQTQPEQE